MEASFCWGSTASRYLHLRPWAPCAHTVPESRNTGVHELCRRASDWARNNGVHGIMQEGKRFGPGKPLLLPHACFLTRRQLSGPATPPGALPPCSASPQLLGQAARQLPRLHLRPEDGSGVKRGEVAHHLQWKKAVEGRQWKRQWKGAVEGRSAFLGSSAPRGQRCLAVRGQLSASNEAGSRRAALPSAAGLLGSARSPSPRRRPWPLWCCGQRPQPSCWGAQRQSPLCS